MTTLVFLIQSATSSPAQEPIRWEPWTFAVEGGAPVTGQLGRLEVPADHGHGDKSGARVVLAFVRLPSRAERPGSPVFYLAGGPGDSGINAIRIDSYRAIFDSLRSGSDVILLDQRGTGLSRPSLACPRELPPTDLFLTEATFRTALLDGMTRCAAMHRAAGIKAAHYTSLESAADIDAIRRALGTDRVQLFGFSYGTHLGLATIRALGNKVERAVLAGVEGPDDNDKLPMTYDANLARLDAAAKRDSSMKGVGEDLLGAFDAAVARLEKEPAQVRIPHPLLQGDSVTLTIGAWGFKHIVARDLGDTNDWPVLPGLLVVTARGEFGRLTAFARRRWGPTPSMMWAAMDCASGSSPERRSAVAAELPRSRFGSAMHMTEPALCKAVNAKDLGEDYRRLVVSDVPTLFISGTLDAQTPPQQAERARRGFRNGVHLIVENAGHESTLSVPEVSAAVIAFLRGQPVAGRTIGVPMPQFIGPRRN